MNTIVMFKHGLPPILHWHYEFIDDGISGTNTKTRDEFNHMIDECMAGNIDMIIAKSISRFARNTLTACNHPKWSSCRIGCQLFPLFKNQHEMPDI